MRRVLLFTLAYTSDPIRAERSRFRWFVDGHNSYRLRVVGILPWFVLKYLEKWLQS